MIPKVTLLSFKTINQQQLLSFNDKSYSHISPAMISEIQKQALLQEFPVIVLQTTRPKAKNLILELKEQNGIKNVVFARGHHTREDREYDLGIFQTGDDNFYLFAQFPDDNNTESSREVINLWKKNAMDFNRYCGIMIAMGASGASRGNPQDKDLFYLFYVQLSEDNQLIFTQ